MTPTAKIIYTIVRQIPPGKVLTYQQVADLAGINSARVVGNILHNNPDPQNIPCHRVVNSKGQLASNYAFGGKEVQRQKLLSESIEIIENSICLKRYQAVISGLVYSNKK